MLSSHFISTPDKFRERVLKVTFTFTVQNTFTVPCEKSSFFDFFENKNIVLLPAVTYRLVKKNSDNQSWHYDLLIPYLEESILCVQS